MNWLIDFIRPKINVFSKNKNAELPDDLWKKCNKCEQMIFHRDLTENLMVCTVCSNHFRIGIYERFNLMFDNGKYEQIRGIKINDDPLKFKDLKKYSDRLSDYRSKTKEEDSINFAIGDVEKIETVIGIMNFEFMGGSMGTYVGQSFINAAKIAISKKAPFIIFTASGGARIQEGILSLMQMAGTVAAIHELNLKKIPYIVVLTDPTMGGVSASFASLGDIIISEPGALIGFAGPKVIEDTIKQKLPKGFQTAEFLLEKGMIDLIVERKFLKSRISNLIKIFINRKDIEKEDGKKIN